MLSTIYTAIINQLNGLGFTEVGPALQDGQPKTPAARVWLALDEAVEAHPSVVRQLTWHVQIIVGHDATVGGAVTDIHSLIDAVRGAFAGWQPTTIAGIQNRSVKVPKIEILNFQDHGNTEYIAQLVMRVIPATVAVKT